MDVRCHACDTEFPVDDVEAHEHIVEARCSGCQTLHLVTAADEPPTLRPSAIHAGGLRPLRPLERVERASADADTRSIHAMAAPAALVAALPLDPAMTSRHRLQRGQPWK